MRSLAELEAVFDAPPSASDFQAAAEDLLRASEEVLEHWVTAKGGDGGLLDMWRYAIDAAGMDWIGDGDHDYGNGREFPKFGDYVTVCDVDSVVESIAPSS